MAIFQFSMTLRKCKEYVLTKRPNELNTPHGTTTQKTTNEEAAPSRPEMHSEALSILQTFNDSKIIIIF